MKLGDQSPTNMTPARQITHAPSARSASNSKQGAALRNACPVEAARAFRLHEVTPVRRASRPISTVTVPGNLHRCLVPYRVYLSGQALPMISDHKAAELGTPVRSIHRAVRSITFVRPVFSPTWLRFSSRMTGTYCKSLRLRGPLLDNRQHRARTLRDGFHAGYVSEQGAVQLNGAHAGGRFDRSNGIFRNDA
jgi:hypothetical protein